MPSCESVASSCLSTSDGRCASFQSFEVMKSSSRRTTDGMTFFRAAPTWSCRLISDSRQRYDGSGHWTCLFLVSVHICAVDEAIPGFHRPYDLQTSSCQSPKCIYAHAATHGMFDLMWFGEPSPEPNLRDVYAVVQLKRLAK